MLGDLVTSFGLGDANVLESILVSLWSLISAVCGAVFNAALGPDLLFQVGECNKASCPGSFYLAITAAWANIGYMTHADFVHFVWNTSFGLWAALFYAVGAAGALVSVSINQPPRTYIWFLLGPAIYSFLVGTPTTVQGVSWRIANKSMEMQDVWRDAETGMANTALVKDVGVVVYRNKGPSGTYQVAWAMVFLDGLFSEATNNLISWIGMQRREGRGGNDTNLFSKDSEEGPWQILSNLKWGMIENVVGVGVKDPDVRDTLATFLTSECGDWFKKGVNAGVYSAASQSRGANIPSSVFIDSANPSTTGENDKPQRGSYQKFVHGLDVESIPTPRSMVRLFNAPQLTGSFRQFSKSFDGSQALNSGRLNDIVCSEYLYMIVQAFRWETGHAYWQLVRSFPDGFKTEAMALKTLFYGWNLRKTAADEMIKDEEVIKYTKFLLLAHMFRNELIIAPQITELGQRFSTSEQMRTFTEAYVRQQGSRAKYGELYQWAVMMPHVQGILAYLVLIGYPFAAMLMVIPGYWKAFFTWVSFLAWVKLWDVGFAIVHTLERSVWAMIGNNSAMARVGRRLINTASIPGADIKVECDSGGGTGAGARLSELCSVPKVEEAGNLSQDDAWFVLDQSLAVAGSLDLDLSNGYYIYIMAALYFAVPAVTGQLVLGAKAGLGGIATQGIGQSATEAGNSAKSATVGDFANKALMNQQSIDQGARMKSYRQTGLAKQAFDQQNAAMDTDVAGMQIGAASKAFDMAGSREQWVADSQASAGKKLGAAVDLGTSGFSWIKNSVPPQPKPGTRLGGVPQPESLDGTGTGGLGANNPGSKPRDLSTVPEQFRPMIEGGSSKPSTTEKNKDTKGDEIGRPADEDRGGLKALSALANYGIASHGHALNRQAIAAKAFAGARGLDFGIDRSGQELFKSGHQNYGQRLGSYADYEAAHAAWDEKAKYSNNAALLGVYGGNPGGLTAGAKPGDMASFGMSGSLGSDTRDSGRYSGSGYFWTVGDAVSKAKSNKGGKTIFGENFERDKMITAPGEAVLAAKSGIEAELLYSSFMKAFWSPPNN